jgi:uncharacterized protein YjbI with pentapeptide repeats
MLALIKVNEGRPANELARVDPILHPGEDGGQEVADLANQEHLDLVRQGTASLNEWRRQNPTDRLDCSGADFRGADLRDANLSGANLQEAQFYKADLSKADLSRATMRGAILSEANLSEANLSGTYLSMAHLTRTRFSGANLRGVDLSRAHASQARLRGADLRDANLSRTDLSRTDLRGADLRGADLNGANLVEAKLNQAKLDGCRVYGISAWNVELEGATQANLIITRPGEPNITVDNLEVAQFVYLLLNNQKIREVIDTITSKVVLILGRFKPERKAVLDGMRVELRRHNLLPILFDFDIPADRDVTETVTLLARMARFVVADLTEPSSIPQELQAIVPDVMVPVQPILQEGFAPWSMFTDFKKYPWVLEIQRYRDLQNLLGSLADKVFGPAEAKRKELAR